MPRPSRPEPLTVLRSAALTCLSPDPRRGWPASPGEDGAALYQPHRTLDSSACDGEMAKRRPAGPPSHERGQPGGGRPPKAFSTVRTHAGCPIKKLRGLSSFKTATAVSSTPAPERRCTPGDRAARRTARRDEGRRIVAGARPDRQEAPALPTASRRPTPVPPDPQHPPRPDPRLHEVHRAVPSAEHQPLPTAARSRRRASGANWWQRAGRAGRRTAHLERAYGPPRRC